MTTNDGPFRWFKVRSGKRVQAREVNKRKVVKTDRGKIVLEPGDMEILGPDGTFYGNNRQQFDATYELDERDGWR